MRLYIIRHADPDYPNNTITPAGHREAEALAQRLAREDLDHFYCSPLGRAQDTMRYTCELLQREGITEERTREISTPMVDMGAYGRISIWDMPGEVIRERQPLPSYEDWHERLPHVDKTPIKERFEEVRRFSDEFLARHGYQREEGRYRPVRPNKERIAVFCHGGFGIAWLAHLLEIPLPLMWSGFWLAPSSVTIVLMEQRSEDWAVPRGLCVGDTSHLYAAGLPLSPRGILANNL